MAPLIFFTIMTSAWQWAALIFVIAIMTDLLDGYLARLWQQTSALGGFLDHCSDAVLVATILLAEALLGWIPFILPILVLCAFTQYALDSKALSGQVLRTSMLGRYNGILYFVLAATPLLREMLSLETMPLETFNLNFLTIEMINIAAYLLCLSTILSMLDRLITLLRNKS
ncbi:MAG: CDP-alcohol phosphatidyltransferase family protein [Pseudomonadales bacterium]|nr:CDP-alcohol phosphatidyltransferase family protein [Pseudomonadales bacterium]